MTISTHGRVLAFDTPAKLNLTLAVVGRRPDGYHDLESWVVMVRWCDRLRFADSEEFAITVKGAGSNALQNSSNLVWRAAVALADAAGRKPTGAITLEKHIPVGAGLGGGSSDAAAALLGLNALWGLQWPAAQLSPIAAHLGSDVPVFLTPGAAVIRRRGEDVERLAESWKGWVALIMPPYPILTAAVYKAFSCMTGDRPVRSSGEQRPWQNPPPQSTGLLSRLYNDLEAAAFSTEPRLGRLHARLDGFSGRRVRMTGSGSCLFTLFDSQDEALSWSGKAAQRLEPGEDIRVVETL
jgi:4-diphosphocytidyl-2-C-methyl-D-erythritol kinase